MGFSDQGTGWQEVEGGFISLQRPSQQSRITSTEKNSATRDQCLSQDFNWRYYTKEAKQCLTNYKAVGHKIPAPVWLEYQGNVQMALILGLGTQCFIASDSHKPDMWGSSACPVLC